MLKPIITCLLILSVSAFGQSRSEKSEAGAERAEAKYEYKPLATTRTSTMQKEMNEAAAEGYRFGAVMGGETAFGGKEAVLIMMKETGAPAKQRYRYLLLATNRTSTMQKELQAAGDEGFDYKGQTVFETTFGGQEVVVILEQDREANPPVYEYKLLATSKTGTMQKEISAEGRNGFALVGLTVAKTAFGGSEVVAILRRVK
ncbi:MAG TPA: hypothetical protein VNQ79_17895 [Blastocatellia bacterium]|nr:hypothetical protein [Blastocatellia bacterium]